MQYNFNANEVQGDPKFEKIPAGAYPATIVDTGLDAKSSGTEQIKIKYKIGEGAAYGREVTEWYTVKCANQTATDIGMRQLKGVCEAVGMAGFRDTTELHGRELVIHLKYKEASDEFPKVSRTSAKGGVAPAAAPRPAAPSAPAPAAAPAAARKPWQK